MSMPSTVMLSASRGRAIVPRRASTLTPARGRGSTLRFESYSLDKNTLSSRPTLRFVRSPIAGCRSTTNSEQQRQNED